MKIKNNVQKYEVILEISNESLTKNEDDLNIKFGYYDELYSDEEKNRYQWMKCSNYAKTTIARLISDLNIFSRKELKRTNILQTLIDCDYHFEYKFGNSLPEECQAKRYFDLIIDVLSIDIKFWLKWKNRHDYKENLMIILKEVERNSNITEKCKLSQPAEDFVYDIYLEKDKCDSIKEQILFFKNMKEELEQSYDFLSFVKSGSELLNKENSELIAAIINMDDNNVISEYNPDPIINKTKSFGDRKNNL